eukprot:1334319-Rhodomonas_salina.1
MLSHPPACCAICLRNCYAMPGTDIAYGVSQSPENRPSAREVSSCAPARQSPVLTQQTEVSCYVPATRCPRMVWDPWYWSRVWWYAMPGTDLADGGMPYPVLDSRDLVYDARY